MNTPFDTTTHLAAAQLIVENSPLWRKFIDGTPLANDIAVWMVEFARSAVECESDDKIRMDFLDGIGAPWPEPKDGKRLLLVALPFRPLPDQAAPKTIREAIDFILDCPESVECALDGKGLDLLSGNRMPPIQGEPRGQAVGSNPEGQVPNLAPADHEQPLSGNRAGEGGDAAPVRRWYEPFRRFDSNGNYQP